MQFSTFRAWYMASSLSESLADTHSQSDTASSHNLSTAALQADAADAAETAAAVHSEHSGDDAYYYSYDDTDDAGADGDAEQYDDDISDDVASEALALQSALRLAEAHVDAVFERLAVACDASGLVSCGAFISAMGDVSGARGMRRARARRAAAAALKLFSLFTDSDDSPAAATAATAATTAGVATNQAVDFAELASGISVLCGSGPVRRAQAAFALYDLEGSGHVTRAELAMYLSSVFRVLALAGGSSPTAAAVAASNAAVAAARGGGGSAGAAAVSFGEFLAWSVHVCSGSGLHDGDDHGDEHDDDDLLEQDESEGDVSDDVSDDVDTAQQQQQQQQQRQQLPAAVAAAAAAGVQLTLAEARALTNLDKHAAAHVFAAFADAADAHGGGGITLRAFQRCFASLVEPVAGRNAAAAVARASPIIDRLFSVFDKNNGEC
jgi:hypothetical protein